MSGMQGYRKFRQKVSNLLNVKDQNTGRHQRETLQGLLLMPYALHGYSSSEFFMMQPHRQQSDLYNTGYQA